MLQVFDLGQKDTNSVGLHQNAQIMTNKLLKDRQNPLTVDHFHLRRDLTAYVEPLYESTEEAEKVAKNIEITYFKGDKPVDFKMVDNQVLIELFGDDMPIIENFMDLIHEAHS